MWRGVFLDGDDEVAAVAAAPQRLGSGPDELGVHVAVGDIVGMTERLDDFRTAVLPANVVVRANGHVDVHAVCVQTADDGGEACVGAEALVDHLAGDLRNLPVQAGQLQDRLKAPGSLLGEAVIEIIDDLCGLFPGASGFQQGLKHGDAGVNSRLGMRVHRLWLILVLFEQFVVSPVGVGHHGLRFLFTDPGEDEGLAAVEQ